MRRLKTYPCLFIRWLKMNHSSSATNGFSPKDTSVFVPEALLSLNQNETNYAVMILNRPINYPVDFIIPFWNKAAFRITVDGGTNRWLSYLDRNQVPIADVSTIDIVSGDFDSLDRSLLERPDLRNTEIIHTPDQNETDFTKALRELSAHCAKKKTKLNSVFVLCQSSGRMDQVMANINTMYKFLAERMMNDAPIYLLSDNSMSWLLDKGESLIMVPESVLKSKNSWCALIPLGGKCEKITSSGLKWNLNDSTMEFGKLVSTSNTFDGSSSVRINTSDILLWSMNIIPLFSALYGVSDEES